MLSSKYKSRNYDDGDRNAEEDSQNEIQRFKIWIDRNPVEQTASPDIDPSEQSEAAPNELICSGQLAINLDVPEQPIGNSQEDLNSYFLETGTYSTCTFHLVDSGVKIPGHHLYFMTRSEWFRREYANSPFTTSFVVKVAGKCTPETFTAFMKCIYTDRLDLDSKLAIDVLNLAYVFDVHNLILRLSVSTELISGISVSSVLNVLMIAVRCSLYDLMKVALDCISACANEVLSQPSFQDVDKHLILIIIEQPDLQITREDLCKRVVGWAKSELRRHKYPCHSHYIRHVLRQFKMTYFGNETTDHSDD